MDPVATRIQQLMDEARWTAGELSRHAGLSDAHVQVLLTRGATRTSGETLAKIAAACSVNLEWLVTGNGPKGLKVYAGEDDPRVKNLPDYLGHLAVARTLRPAFGEYVWKAVGDAHPLITAPLSPGLLVKMAEILVEYLPPPPAPKPAPKRKRSTRGSA